MKCKRLAIVLVFLIFFIISLLVFNLSTIQGKVLGMYSLNSGKVILVQVNYSNFVSAETAYLYYDTDGIDPGDEVLAFCRPIVELSDPPYVGVLWLYRKR